MASSGFLQPLVQRDHRSIKRLLFESVRQIFFHNHDDIEAQRSTLGDQDPPSSFSNQTPHTIAKDRISNLSTGGNADPKGLIAWQIKHQHRACLNALTALLDTQKLRSF